MCRAASAAVVGLLTLLHTGLAATLAATNGTSEDRLVIVVTEYWDKSRSCEGTPIKVDTIRADTLAMMHYGADSLICSSLAPNLHAAYGVSMRFLKWEDSGTCALQYFDDPFCEDERIMRDLYSGACKGWHGGRINRRRLAMLRGHQFDGSDEILGVEADEDFGQNAGKPVIPHNIHASAMSSCTNEATPEGAFDKTCVAPQDLIGMPKVNLDMWGSDMGNGHLCFVGCLGRGNPLRELENKEQFDALFAEGGCAAPCDSEGRIQLLKMLAIDDRLDCNYRPLPIIHEPMVYIPGDPYHERIKAKAKQYGR
mmetsp:Transcript_45899/g.106714  ORF Transcript_45899/g.106714 Transcript_45899/m.106714 type:complete len:311 (-) Transcript_45899:174-1106(-)